MSIPSGSMRWNRSKQSRNNRRSDFSIRGNTRRLSYRLSRFCPTSPVSSRVIRMVGFLLKTIFSPLTTNELATGLFVLNVIHMCTYAKYNIMCLRIHANTLISCWWRNTFVLIDNARVERDLFSILFFFFTYGTRQRHVRIYFIIFFFNHCPRLSHTSYDEGFFFLIVSVITRIYACRQFIVLTDGLIN